MKLYNVPRNKMPQSDPSTSKGKTQPERRIVTGGGHLNGESDKKYNSGVGKLKVQGFSEKKAYRGGRQTYERNPGKLSRLEQPPKKRHKTVKGRSHSW